MDPRANTPSVWRATTISALAAVTVGVAASAAAARWQLIASGEHYALYSTVAISGKAPKPQAVALKVLADPHQDVYVKWTMTCKTSSGPRRSSGTYVSREATLQTLRLPAPLPSSCDVSADGKLSGGGTLTMRLYFQAALSSQPPWAKRLFSRLISVPYRQSELPAGFGVVGINPLVPADGLPVGLVDVKLRSAHARYDLLYDMQAGTGRWAASTRWATTRRDAATSGAVVFHPPLGHSALCSYVDLGTGGLDIACAAWVNGVLVQVEPPNPLVKAQTNEAVAVLRSAIAHLRRVRGG